MWVSTAIADIETVRVEAVEQPRARVDHARMPRQAASRRTRAGERRAAPRTRDLVPPRRSCAGRRAAGDACARRRMALMRAISSRAEGLGNT